MKKLKNYMISKFNELNNKFWRDINIERRDEIKDKKRSFKVFSPSSSSKKDKKYYPPKKDKKYYQNEIDTYIKKAKRN